MHPIERLRYVARADGATSGAGELAIDAADGLAAVAAEPAALVTGCRRLLERHPEAGPLWWLAAHALCASDPRAALADAAHTLSADATPGLLRFDLPDDGRVLIVGWPELASASLLLRGDVSVLVVDGADGRVLARRLEREGHDVARVDDIAVAAAALAADVVLVEALAAEASGGIVAAAGSLAAAAVARHAGVPVWAVVGEGRVLPAPLWGALRERLASAGEAWEAEHDVIPLDLVDRVAGPVGLEAPGALSARSACPVPTELLRGAGDRF